MKRNKLMAAACLLLALTMITTSTFSGVLAKYIVSDGATDSARVAKFGVVVSAAGDLFGKGYTDDIRAWTSATTASVTGAGASKDAADEIVAPGTQNLKGMTFTIKGTPEVSTKVTVDRLEGTGEADILNSDIYLKQGAYSIMVPITATTVTLTDDNCGNYYNYTPNATAGRNGSFAPLATAGAAGATIYKKVELLAASGTNKMAADYYPIAWSVKDNVKTTDNITVCTNVAAVDTAVLAALGGATSTKDPNETYNNSATVTWSWSFGSAWSDTDTADAMIENWENTSLTDLEDTILGQMIALATATGEEDYKIACGNDEVLFKEIPATDTSENSVWVAYVDTANDAPEYATSNKVVACLTAAYGARLTVEQVD